MNYRNNFANNLLNLRKSNKLTLQTLADELGISNQAVSLLEKGKNAPSFDILMLISDYFNVSIDYLVGRDDSQKLGVDIMEISNKLDSMFNIARVTETSNYSDANKLIKEGWLLLSAGFDTNPDNKSSSPMYILGITEEKEKEFSSKPKKLNKLEEFEIKRNKNV